MKASLLILLLVPMLAGCTDTAETQSGEDLLTPANQLPADERAAIENSSRKGVHIASGADGAPYLRVLEEPTVNQTYQIEMGANSKATWTIRSDDWNYTVVVSEPSIITVAGHNQTGRYMLNYTAQGDGWYSAANFTIDVWGEPIEFPAEPAGHRLRPGIQSQVCTTNYLFHYKYYRYFIGTAAHCMGNGVSLEGECRTNAACEPRIENLEFGFKATHAYNSYQAQTEFGGGSGQNDFGLFEISPEYYANMHPKVHGIVGHVKGLGDCRTLDPSPAFGGSGTELEIIGYGRSSLRHGLGLTSAPDRQWDDKIGEFLVADNGGFQCHVYMATPGIPGDSGGPIATADHYALGAASTVTLYPTTGSNHYTNIAAALEYMETNLGWKPELLTS